MLFLGMVFLLSANVLTAMEGSSKGNTKIFIAQVGEGECPIPDSFFKFNPHFLTVYDMENELNKNDNSSPIRINFNTIDFDFTSENLNQLDHIAQNSSDLNSTIKNSAQAEKLFCAAHFLNCTKKKLENSLLANYLVHTRKENSIISNTIRARTIDKKFSFKDFLQMPEEIKEVAKHTKESKQDFQKLMEWYEQDYERLSSIVKAKEYTTQNGTITYQSTLNLSKLLLSNLNGVTIFIDAIKQGGRWISENPSSPHSILREQLEKINTVNASINSLNTLNLNDVPQFPYHVKNKTITDCGSIKTHSYFFSTRYPTIWNLSHNKISSIQPCQNLTYGASIVHLNLSHNELEDDIQLQKLFYKEATNTPKYPFKYQCPALSSLELAHNKLTYITLPVSHHAPHKNFFLDLSYNTELITLTTPDNFRAENFWLNLAGCHKLDWQTRDNLHKKFNCFSKRNPFLQAFSSWDSTLSIGFFSYVFTTPFLLSCLKEAYSPTSIKIKTLLALLGAGSIILPHYKHNAQHALAHLSCCISLGTLLSKGIENAFPFASQTAKKFIPFAATGVFLLAYTCYRGTNHIQLHPQLILPEASQEQIDIWNKRLKEYKRSC